MKVRHIVIFIWVSLASVAVMLQLVKFIDHSKADAEFAIEEDELWLDSLDASMDTTMLADELTTDSVLPRPVPVERIQYSDTTLPHLAAALLRAGSEQVRVLHYGDSQIEEDRITSTLRRRLQSTYGGRGVGLIPLHQTIPTLSLRQRLYINGRQQTNQQGPQRHLIYGPKNWRLPAGDTMYGPMGQVAVLSDSLVSGSEDVMLTLDVLSGTTRHTCVRLLADSAITAERVSGIADTMYITGRGKVYGLSLESETGVLVDNIPMRGCIGTIFTGIDSLQLATFYRDSHTRLIILQFGGNAIPQNKKETTIRGICYGLRDQIRFLRQCAPEADILFIGPSDMLEVNEEGVLTSCPRVRLMDETLRTLLAREGVPYFSLFHAMGAEGSMQHWQDIGWAGSDGVHFTRSGADHAADLLWQWLEPMLNRETNKVTQETQ